MNTQEIKNKAKVAILNYKKTFVCYFRKNMIYCNGKKVIKGETFYYKK